MNLPVQSSGSAPELTGKEMVELQQEQEEALQSAMALIEAFRQDAKDGTTGRGNLNRGKMDERSMKVMIRGAERLGGERASEQLAGKEGVEEPKSKGKPPPADPIQTASADLDMLSTDVDTTATADLGKSDDEGGSQVLKETGLDKFGLLDEL